MTKERAKSNEKKHPDVDGGWAWIFLIGGFIGIFVVSGTMKCFGIVYTELLNQFDSGPAQTGWAVFTHGIFCTVSGFISGNLIDRITMRWPLMFLGLLGTVGMIISAFAPTLPLYIIGYGALGGAANGMLQTCVQGVMGKFFTKRIVIAFTCLGIAGSLSTILFPLLLRWVLNQYGVTGAMIALAGVWAHACFTGATIRPDPMKRHQQEDPGKEILSKCQPETGPPQSTQVSQSKDGVMEITVSKSDLQSNEYILEIPQTPVQETGDCGLASSTKHPPEPPDVDSIDGTQGCCCDPVCSNLIGCLNLFKNTAFLRLVVALFSYPFAYYGFFLYLPSYSAELGMSKTDAAFCVMATAFSELVSRIVIGSATQKSGVNPGVPLFFCTVVSAMSCYVLPFVGNRASTIAFSCLIGLTGGMFNVFFVVLLVRAVGRERVGTAVGINQIFYSTGAGTNGPVLGLLQETSGTYVTSMRGIGVAYTISGILILWNLVTDIMNSRRRQTQKHQTRE